MPRGGWLALYLGVCGVIGGLLAALLAGERGLQWTDALALSMPLAAVYAFVCLSAWYVARTVPLGATRILRVAATAASAAVITSAAWLALAHGWILVLAGRWGRIDAAAVAGVETLIFGVGLLLYLLSLAISYLLVAFERSLRAERATLEAQVLSREAELRLLRAQIDPHFLFNSLHSISALTVADPAGARRMCLLLADFLRDSLALRGDERIPLGRELDLARRYLDIARVRFGERLDISIDAGDASSVLVPPLVLQPLIENAVTHGIAHSIERGTIRIAADRSVAYVSIVVENPCDPDRPASTGAGVGLANVRGRLRAVYGGEARIDAAEALGTWRVEVRMPIDAETGNDIGSVTP